VKNIPCLLIAAHIFYFSYSQKTSVSFEQWISLKQVGSPVISPDGKLIVYSITSTDWADNQYNTELWLTGASGMDKGFQLTRTNKGSSTSARFSPDGKWISFLADRGNKKQIYIISPSGGEAMPITSELQDIDNYRWSHDGKYIAYTKNNSEDKKEKIIRERYGAFDVEDQGFKQNSLWLIHFDYDSISQAGGLPCYTTKQDSSKEGKSNSCPTLPKPVQLTNENYYISNFEWNPDNKYIAFNFQPDNRVKTSAYSHIALISLLTKKIEVVVKNQSADDFQAWDKGGGFFVYSTHLDDTTSNFYTNNRLFIYDISKKSSEEILRNFDENKNVAEWNEDGIFFFALEKMKNGLYRYDPLKKEVNRINIGLDVLNGASFSKENKMMAIAGRDFSSLAEIYSISQNSALNKLTSLNRQIQNWETPVNEIIQWKSKDGTQVEGVLLKPKNFDEHKKYPLLVVIHGGPTGVDRPEPVPTYVYPIMQWCEKGAIVLRLNYRGSAGYGEKFRALNVNNLGVGDMWDVISGVRYLTTRGIVDTSKMGCMGWSQGGYISAFLTTNTTIFKAISVGAGISDWMTYYVNTDITPFTIQYLKSTPWSDPAIYQKTSPITHIKQARTPTLIQHGEFDKRVPNPNGYELYRGLLDNGVPSKLIIYKGFGHGITKPRERLAATWHNWIWFNHYVFGEKLEELPGIE
jgi:dipeptidyl aminopeptidase/acylaminoacyl peptidase